MGIACCGVLCILELNSTLARVHPAAGIEYHHQVGVEWS